MVRPPARRRAVRPDDDEELVLDLRPHAKALVRPVLVLLLGLAVAGYAAARVHGAPGRTGVGVVAGLLLARLSLLPFLRWRSTRFVLTDERIALRRGVLRRTGRDLPLERVDDVTFTRTLRQRLQGCGTLVVHAGDAGPVVVEDLPDVEAVQREVHRQLARQPAREATP